MRNCLQLCSDDYDFVGEFEKNRAALVAARVMLKKNNDDIDSLLAARALLRTRMSGDCVSDNLVNEIGGRRAISPAAISPADYNCGMALWAGCLISTLGEALLQFVSRVVDKLEKREYFL